MGECVNHSRKKGRGSNRSKRFNPPDLVRGPFSEVEVIVTQGELIEDYPNDLRGHSCLMLGFGDGARAVHVVCSPKDEYLAIITAYLPDPAQWSEDFRRRR